MIYYVIIIYVPISKMIIIGKTIQYDINQPKNVKPEKFLQLFFSNI